MTVLETSATINVHDVGSEMARKKRVQMRIFVGREGNIKSPSRDQLTEPFPPFMSSLKPSFSLLGVTKIQYLDIIYLNIIYIGG